MIDAESLQKIIECQRIADDVVRKCRDWRKTELEPGQYTAILEHTAV